MSQNKKKFEQVAVVLLCAGSGSRMGGENKLLRPLVGYNSIARSLKTMISISEGPIAIVISDEIIDEVKEVIEQLDGQNRCFLVNGGTTRGDSVFKGLTSLKCANPKLVVIHDGARPLIDRQTVLDCLESARTYGSGIAAIPVVDTLKRVDENVQLIENIDRQSVWQIQTPQCFVYQDILKAYQISKQRNEIETDDSSIYAKLGKFPRMVMSSRDNFKLTLEQDIEAAQKILLKKEGELYPTMRIGFGEDSHCLKEGRKLIIGGQHIPFHKGLLGHSDADMLAHAISDALLGALAMGDIGQHFPDNDEKFKDMDSMNLLKKVYDLINRNNYIVSNIDCTIVAQEPKLADYIVYMRKNIAKTLNVNVNAISIKATTGEKMGFEGRGEGMTTRVVALLIKKDW